MTTNKMALALGGLNLALLLLLATQSWPANAEAGPEVLRVTGLELVDAQGRLRATLNIQPGDGSVGETVLFRLINSAGQPSVKLSASDQATALSMVGGDDLSFVLIGADGAEPGLRLNAGDREARLAP